MAPEEIEALARVLDLPVANVQSHLGAQWWPNRGLGPMPPTDPVIYRLYEVHATILHSREFILILVSSGSPSLWTCN